jgi:hypothetical protein
MDRCPDCNGSGIVIFIDHDEESERPCYNCDEKGYFPTDEGQEILDFLEAMGVEI